MHPVHAGLTFRHPVCAALAAVLLLSASCAVLETDVEGEQDGPALEPAGDEGDPDDEPAADVEFGEEREDEPEVPGDVPPGDDPPAEPELSQTQRAIDFGLGLLGTPYGWWYSGPLPAGAPMWTKEAPAPSPERILSRSANCTGLTNLMLRSVGLPLPKAAGAGRGGTYAYQRYYSDVAKPFKPNVQYPAGTLVGRRYRDTYDQGHVAVVLDDGHLLQSFAWNRGGSMPGVNATYTVAESHSGGFYEYVVYPDDWIGATPPP